MVAHLVEHLGKPLKPRQVHIVPALPKTRSGKILRSTIQRAYTGDAVGDLSSVENPDALDEIIALSRAQASTAGGS